ncbi:MAG: AmmeMemoRadiSam system radical SAM enzyme [Tenuifilaceae bacterium]
MGKISKREFLKQSAICAGGILCAGAFNFARASTEDKLWKWSREAIFYSNTPRGVKCGICPNECTLKLGETSTCHNRVNHNEKLYSIAYGNPCAVHVDPIEKKPLLHFLPNSYAFSIATAGCNLACLNCQNWDISQTSPKETKNIDLMPARVVEECIKNNCQSIAYTYSEPISFYEYVYDTAKIARSKGIKNVFISNGYINDEPLKALAPYLDAANINLKSFSDAIYLKLNGGKLQPILNTLKTLKDNNVWLEITNLVVPSWTDDFEMIKKMCDWLVSNGFSEYPLHFSRFYPLYKLTQLPQTPINTLLKAKEIAESSGCKYVYIGNVPMAGTENTICPKCRKMIVARKGFAILSNQIENGKCKFCGAIINGVWV